MKKTTSTRTKHADGIDISTRLAATQTVTKLQQIPLTDIQVDGAQIRQSLCISVAEVVAGVIEAGDPEKQNQLDDIIALAKTISNIGLLEPVITYLAPGNKYRLIAGERRVLASHYAHNHLNGPALIDARVYPKEPQPNAIANIQFIENYHRKNLTLAEVISWTLRQFNAFEVETETPITNLDIQKMMVVKKSMARHYLNIYNADRARVDSLLESAKLELITSLKEFAHLATHPQEPLPTPNQDEQNQIEEAAQKEAAGGEGRATFKVGLSFSDPHTIEAYIKKNTTAKQFQKYAKANWESSRDAGTALRKFFADWEAKH